MHQLVNKKLWNYLSSVWNVMKYVRLLQLNNINFKRNGTNESEENHKSIVITIECQIDIYILDPLKKKQSCNLKAPLALTLANLEFHFCSVPCKSTWSLSVHVWKAKLLPLQNYAREIEWSWNPSQGRPCDFYSEGSSNERSYCRNTSVFSCQYISNGEPHCFL
jgi:hypothetical protein